MAGQQVAGGAADNPLKARWMGVNGAVGIHGTGRRGRSARGRRMAASA